MLKILKLRNKLLGSTTTPWLEELLTQKPEYREALQSLFNLIGWIDILVKCPGAVSEIVSSETALDLLRSSLTASTKLIAYKAGLEPVRYPDMQKLCEFDSTVDLVVTSSEASSLLFDSHPALSEFIKSTTAVVRLCANTTSRTELLKHPAAVSIVCADDMATAKVSCALAGRNEYTSFTSVASMVGNATYMNAVAASDEAMQIFANAAGAMEKSAANDTAMTSLVANSISMDAIASSAVAMPYMSASSTAMSKIAGSSTAMNSLVAVRPAMDILMVDTVAVNKLKTSSTALPIMASAQHAMEALCAVPSAFTDFIAQSAARTAFLNADVALNTIAATADARDQLCVNSEAYTAFLANEKAVCKLAVGYATIEPTVVSSAKTMANLTKQQLSMLANSPKSMELLADSSIAMEKIVVESALMTVFADSITAMEALAYNQSALEAVAGNVACMDILCASDNAVGILYNSPLALKIIGAQTAASAKFLAALISLPSSDITDVATLTGNTKHMQAICSTPRAINAMCKSTTAMTAVKSSDTALTAISLSAVALAALCRNSVGAELVESSLQAKRSSILETLAADAGTTFTKTAQVTVGDGVGTFEDGEYSASIYFPVLSTDDGNTDLSVNSIMTGTQVTNLPKYNGTVQVTAGFTLRGTRVVGTGSPTGQVTFDRYVVAVDSEAVKAQIIADPESAAKSLDTLEHAAADENTIKALINTPAVFDALLAVKQGASALADSSLAMRYIVDTPVHIKKFCSNEKARLALWYSDNGLTALQNSETVVSSLAADANRIISKNTASQTYTFEGQGTKCILLRRWYNNSSEKDNIRYDRKTGNLPGYGAQAYTYGKNYVTTSTVPSSDSVAANNVRACNGLTRATWSVSCTMYVKYMLV